MITADQLRRYESAGVVAAARAFQLHTTTIHRLARMFGVEFKSNNTLAEQCRRERSRKAMAGKVRELARKRLTQCEICAALGISRWTLRRIADEHHIDINSRSLY
jgi:hypothetical protein